MDGQVADGLVVLRDGDLLARRDGTAVDFGQRQRVGVGAMTAHWGPEHRTCMAM
ncbi:MAG: hypothetical protein RMJ82_13250 [Gemmatales bacterium]|nr:hypothetical protein [Gemmatales bacterium]